MLCQGDAVSARCHAKNGVVPSRWCGTNTMTTWCRGKTTPCQYDVMSKKRRTNGSLPTRCRAIRTECHKRRRIKLAPCQHDIVSSRRREHAMSCQKMNSCQPDIVSRRCRVNTAPCQCDVVSKLCRGSTMSWQYDAMSRRHFVKTMPCQHNAVSRRNIIMNDAV